MPKPEPRRRNQIVSIVAAVCVLFLWQRSFAQPPDEFGVHAAELAHVHANATAVDSPIVQAIPLTPVINAQTVESSGGEDQPSWGLADPTSKFDTESHEIRLHELRAGYDDGFVIMGDGADLQGEEELLYRLKINGWGQLRATNFQSHGTTSDLNQFQLKRARLILSGHAFTPDFLYFVQLDGRSTSGDEVRMLDYYLNYDLGHHLLGRDSRSLVFKAGKYKMPFTLARYISSQKFQFTDRSVASTFFDVNRSIAWGLYGESLRGGRLLNWEAAMFNGLITGGAETGSSGDLDNNFAFSARIMGYSTGDWGADDLCDYDWHCEPVFRYGAAAAFTRIDRIGSTEFSNIRMVDSGLSLSVLLPFSVTEYSVGSYCVDASLKYRGFSFTSEYYFRNTYGFQGATVPSLFDHGFWLQAGYFLVPKRLEILGRWSRVSGDSGSLGLDQQSSDERALGAVFYFRRHHAKITVDATYLDGAPVDSQSLDVFPGAHGWMARSQVQFSF